MARSRAEYDEIKSDMEKLSKKLESVAAVAEAPTALMDKAQEILSNGREQLKTQIDSMVKSTKKASKRVSGFVQENPWQVAGAVLAASALTAYLVNKNQK